MDECAFNAALVISGKRERGSVFSHLFFFLPFFRSLFIKAEMSMIRHILTCAVITAVLSTWSISIKAELRCRLCLDTFTGVNIAKM